MHYLNLEGAKLAKEMKEGWEVGEEYELCSIEQGYINSSSFFPIMATLMFQETHKQGMEAIALFHLFPRN